ncbi:MAG: hypothetical protein H6574_10210 [Lewinellaceae bacterium]|nr:hypothetical protein [Saprospiraceae bacterium]MCB9314729.1 hypothetical protein [Lewinellaceae bacterium]MCB9331446.1 hypothetical protein [Lewinellaceae bacterium]
MKNSAILLLLFIAGLAACIKESDVKQTTAQTAIPNKVDIVTESGIKKYMSLLPDTPWQDLDAFYKEGIEKYHNRPDLLSFKNTAIFYLVRFYNILDDPSASATERIAYYTQEMASLKNCNPAILYPMLMRLQGHWEPSKIAQTAEMGYKNSMLLTKLVSKNKNQPAYAEINKGMEDLKSLYEAKD